MNGPRSVLPLCARDLRLGRGVQLAVARVIFEPKREESASLVWRDLLVTIQLLCPPVPTMRSLLRSASQRLPTLQCARAAAAFNLNCSGTLAAVVPLPRPGAAVAYFHSTPSAAFAAPAAAAAAAKPAGKPAAAAAGPAGPPAEGSDRWMKEGWGQATIIPEIRPAITTAEESAALTAEAEAAKVLPIIHAAVREKGGSKYCQELRKNQLRIPGENMETEQG